MEVLTILGRNILKKKGIFICIVLLSILIVSAFLSILGVKSSFEQGYDRLSSELNSPKILSYMFDSYYDIEMKDKISNVKGVSYVDEVFGVTSPNNRHRTRSGDSVSKVMDTNTHLIEAFSDNKDKIKLFNNSLNGYLDDIPELNKGEIYLPLGLKDKLRCQIGDYYVDDFGLYIDLDSNGNEFYNSKVIEFKIKGFVASPIFGSNTIGYKEVFISDEDFNELMELSISGTKLIQENHLSSKENYSLVDVIYKIHSDGSISDYDLLKRINNETKLGNFAEGTITSIESKEYTGMHITIIGGVLIGFVVILLIINLVVIANSVSGEIETDYKKLGILKALGFTNFKIGLIISLLYLVAEAIGFIIGLIISVFLKMYLGSLFISITALVPANDINILNVFLILLIMFASSILFIFIKSIRLRRISPIKAINNSSNDIYFSPKLNTKISKKCLGLSLSVKQLLSSPLRYISIVIVTALLAFFMLTAIRMSNFTRGKNVFRIMGEPISDIAVSAYSETPFTYDMMNEVKDIAQAHSEIDFMLVRCSEYISMNDDNILANICMNSKDILGLYKGKAPEYDNEFVATKNVCERYKLNIGDKVVLSSKTGSQEFILVGLYQNTRDTGKNICISYEGAKKINENIKLFYMNLELKDKSKVDIVINELKDISSHRFNVIDCRNEVIPELEEYKMISDIICIIILSFAIIFILIAVRLITVKTFNQERLDLGIYKAVGFNTFSLRNSLSLRFMLASIIGIIFGIILSLLFSNQLLGLMLSSLGMNNMYTNNTFIDYLLLIIIGLIVTYASAFIASRRIKTIATRELVVE